MFNILIVLAMIIAVLLILVVLIQNPKGGGLSSEFGGTSNQMFGVKKTGDLLEQITWGFAATIMVICLVSRFFGDVSDNGINSVNIEKAATKAIPTAPAPAPAPAPANK